MAAIERFLDRYLDPVADALTPAAARRVLELQPDPEVSARVQELGLKSNAGTLTDAERDAYRWLADAGTLVSMLKAKACSALMRDRGHMWNCLDGR